MSQIYQTPDGRLFELGADDMDFALGEDFLIDGDDDFEDDEDDDDFAGDFMISGDELDSIFAGDEMEFSGRGRGSKKRKRLAALKRRALARMGGGFSAKRKPALSQGYKLTLPFGQTFAANTGGTITLTPQRSFRLEQLVVGASTAALFNLNSLNVGQDNQFIASGAMNMEVFSHLAQQRVGLAGSTANLGTTIVLAVTNLDATNPQTLSGMLMGPTILQAG